MVAANVPATCRHCGRPLPEGSKTGRTRLYCDATCRSAARRERARRSAEGDRDVRDTLTDAPRKASIDAMLSAHAAALDAAAPLEAVAAARRLAELVDRLLRESVDRARRAGHTWQDVGAVLGTTRQAAFQRFGRAVDPRTGVPMAPVRPGAVEHAAALVDAVAHGRWADACADFDARVRERLSPEGLAGAWAQTAGLVGGYEGMGEPYALRAGDYTVVNVPLHFEAGDRVARISYDDDGKVAGLFLLPPDGAS